MIKSHSTSNRRWMIVSSLSIESWMEVQTSKWTTLWRSIEFTYSIVCFLCWLEWELIACNTCPFHLMTISSFILIIQGGLPDNWYKMLTQTYELAEKCIQTNYYGNKRMCEALIPLLQLSDSPRIVNASSSMGKLKVKHTSKSPSSGNNYLVNCGW